MVLLNKIDELLDSTLDNFFKFFVIEDKYKIIEKIKTEKMFITYESLIYNTIDEFLKKIDIQRIKSIVSIEENINKIIGITKRYVTYYTFLIIGYYYSDTDDDYINNLMEFNRSYSVSGFKVNDFFNSTNISQLIKLYKLIKNTNSFLHLDEKSKLAEVKKSKNNITKYTETIAFLEELKSEFVQDKFNIVATQKNNILGHNITKTVIYQNLYVKKEKNDIYEILYEIEKSKGEYIYITVVNTSEKEIDSKSIEDVLSRREINAGKGLEIYDFINNFYSQKSTVLTADEKIRKLVQSSLIIPIVDDFLKYNKSSERYDKFNKDEQGASFDTSYHTLRSKQKKKEETKLKYIVNKISKVTNLYSSNTSPEEKKEIETYFYQPYRDKKAILYNEIEELKIINKMTIAGQQVMEKDEYYSEFLQYRNPFINFKNFSNTGITVQIEKPITVVRSVSFEVPKNIIHTRTANRESYINLVGLMFNPSGISEWCLNSNNVYDVRNIKYSKGKISNGMESFIRYISSSLVLKKGSHAIRWIFDLEKDLSVGDEGINSEDLNQSTAKGSNVKNKQQSIKSTTSGKKSLEKEKLQDQVSSIPTLNQQDRLMIILADVYDNLTLIVYKFISNSLRTLSLNSSYTSNIEYKKFYVQKLFRDLLEIPKDHLFYNRISAQIYFDEDSKSGDVTSVENDKIEMIDEAEKQKEKFPLLDAVQDLEDFSKKYMLITPNYFRDPSNDKEIKSSSDKDFGKEDLNDNDDDNAICEHNLIWDDLKEMKNTNAPRYEENLAQFINTYTKKVNDTSYVCISCGIELDINVYLQTGIYDDEGKFVYPDTRMDTPLEDLEEYYKIKSIIPIIDKLIERIASIALIKFYIGTEVINRARRKPLMKSIIDLTILHNIILGKINSQIGSARLENAEKKYDIKKSKTLLIPFEINETLFLGKSSESLDSTEKEELNQERKYNLNLFLLYIILNFMVELNDDQLVHMNQTAEYNYKSFNKNFSELFSNVKIIINNKGDTDLLKNYPVLCYVLYLFISVTVKNKLWTTNVKTDLKNLNKNKPEKKDSSANAVKENIAKTKKVKKEKPLAKATLLAKATKNKQSRDSKKQDPNIIPNIEIAIQTSVDLLNSILEINTRKNKKYLYTVFAAKFFRFLQHIYSSSNLLERIEKITDIKQKKYYETVSGLSTLRGKIDDGILSLGNYNPNYRIKHRMINKFELKNELINANTITPKVLDDEEQEKNRNLQYANNITNCPDGSFHSWANKNGELVCNKCKQKLNNLFYSDVKSSDIAKNYELLQTKKLSKKYCPNGTLHQFQDSADGRMISKNCGKYEGEEYTAEELNELGENRKNKKREKRQKLVDEYLSEKQKVPKETKYLAFIDEYYKLYLEKKDSYISEFIQTLEDIQGKRMTLDKGSDTYYLNEDTYIFDHEYNGNKISTPIILRESDAKIKYKTNHVFFKEDVIIFTKKVPAAVDIFYDLHNFIYLGYQEHNKNYVSYLDSNENKNNREILYLRINHSLENKIKQIGFSSRYINLEPYIQNNKFEYPDSTDLSDKIYDDLLSERLDNVKSCLLTFQTFIYELSLYKSSASSTVNPKEPILPKGSVHTSHVSSPFRTLDNILEKYKKSLSTLKDKLNFGEDKEKLLFRKAKYFRNYVTASSEIEIPKEKETLNLNKDKNFVSSYDINSIDNRSNLILFYLLKELQKLIKIDSNKVIKIHLINMILDLFNYCYSKFSDSTWMSIHDVKRFKLILESGERVIDTEKKGELLQDPNNPLSEDLSSLTESELAQHKEEEQDAKAEQDALDFDGQQEMEADGEFIHDFSAEDSVAAE